MCSIELLDQKIFGTHEMDKFASSISLSYCNGIMQINGLKTTYQALCCLHPLTSSILVPASLNLLWLKFFHHFFYFIK